MYRQGMVVNMQKKTGYTHLLQTVCVDLGFCGCVKDGKPLHVHDFIPQEGTITADDFVEWVFLADALDLTDRITRQSTSRKAIREAFVKHMGGDEADASEFKA